MWVWAFYASTSFSSLQSVRYVVFVFGKQGHLLCMQKENLCSIFSLSCVGMTSGTPQPENQPNATQSHHWESPLTTVDGQLRFHICHHQEFFLRYTPYIQGSFCCTRFPHRTLKDSKFQLSFPTFFPFILLLLTHLIPAAATPPYASSSTKFALCHLPRKSHVTHTNPCLSKVSGFKNKL